MSERASLEGTRSVLFVCLGNICRSPLAEGIFLRILDDAGVREEFTVESCGTGAWHAGEAADPRSCEVARKNGLELCGVARQLRTPHDFERFELLVPMDRQNLGALLQAGAPGHRVRLMRTFDASTGGEPLDVPDPYWGGDRGFDEVYEMLHRACLGLAGSVGVRGV